jgi:hypothetical protein
MSTGRKRGGGSGVSRDDPRISERRREFLRSLITAGYAAPAVTTVLLAALQPSDPSGGMMKMSAARAGRPRS